MVWMCTSIRASGPPNSSALSERWSSGLVPNLGWFYSTTNQHLVLSCAAMSTPSTTVLPPQNLDLAIEPTASPSVLLHDSHAAMSVIAVHPKSVADVRGYMNTVKGGHISR